MGLRMVATQDLIMEVVTQGRIMEAVIMAITIPATVEAIMAEARMEESVRRLWRVGPVMGMDIIRKRRSIRSIGVEEVVRHRVAPTLIR